MSWTVADFFSYMDSPGYKARVEAARYARENAEDAYFDGLGVIVEGHPVGRPVSHLVLASNSADSKMIPTAAFNPTAKPAQKTKATPVPDYSRITRDLSRKP